MTDMKILDISCGNRAIWFDKAAATCTYIDRRASVRPDIVADSMKLPLMGPYDLIVFDPPHVNGGKNSNIARDYGHHTTSDIKKIIHLSAKEAHRVSRPNAMMAFKWNDHDQKLERALELMAPWWIPLFGHSVSMRTKHSSQTYWMLLLRGE